MVEFIFLGIKSFYNDYKQQKRTKCLGWPVASYGPGLMEFLVDIE